MDLNLDNLGKKPGAKPQVRKPLVKPRSVPNKQGAEGSQTQQQNTQQQPPQGAEGSQTKPKTQKSAQQHTQEEDQQRKALQVEHAPAQSPGPTFILPPPAHTEAVPPSAHEDTSQPSQQQGPDTQGPGTSHDFLNLPSPKARKFAPGAGAAAPRTRPSTVPVQPAAAASAAPEQPGLSAAPSAPAQAQIGVAADAQVASSQWQAQERVVVDSPALSQPQLLRPQSQQPQSQPQSQQPLPPPTQQQHIQELHSSQQGHTHPLAQQQQYHPQAHPQQHHPPTQQQQGQRPMTPGDMLHQLLSDTDGGWTDGLGAEVGSLS